MKVVFGLFAFGLLAMAIFAIGVLAARARRSDRSRVRGGLNDDSPGGPAAWWWPIHLGGASSLPPATPDQTQASAPTAGSFDASPSATPDVSSPSSGFDSCSTSGDSGGCGGGGGSD